MIRWNSGLNEFVDFLMWEGEIWNSGCKEEDVCKCTPCED